MSSLLPARRRLPRLVALAALAPFVACSAPSPPGPTSRAAAAPATDAQVAHRDARLGVPSFVWLGRDEAKTFGDARSALAAIAPRAAGAFGLRDAMLETLGEAAIDEATRGPIVARYAQRIGGIEVFRGGIAVALTRAFEPVAASGFLAPTTLGSERPFARSPREAAEAAVLRVAGRALALGAEEQDDDYRLSAGAGLARPARVKPTLFPVTEGEGERRGAVRLEPAYYVEVALPSGVARATVISALDGRALWDVDLVRYDAFTYAAFADPTTFLPSDGPQGNGWAPHPTGRPDRAKLTYEAPRLVTLANVPFSKNDPWLPPGATTTRGNNVVAYADVIGPTGFLVGTEDVAPAFTAPATFGAIYDTNLSPSASRAQREAAATHLFYVTNFLHDWFYDAGFDEASGNHQIDNFGRGGKGGDALRAEAQDFSGRNNANAQVPADGTSPIIQMFVFTGPTNATLEVTAPTEIAGLKGTGIANGFGDDRFDLSGGVVVASDGQGPDDADACEPLSAEARGKIVLAHRGNCAFAQKAQNAQAAGAVGCIIANVASSVDSGVAPFMGGTANGISIPVLSLNLADGRALEAAATAGSATVTMRRSASGDLDGALDTGIVAHEWGHVLSGRLVANGAGLSTNQAGGLGEGWGDFTALLLSARRDDPGAFAGAYSNGAYATSGSGDDVYFGTRRVPYSIDFTKNALTFKHIENGVPLPKDAPTSFGEDGASNAEVHNTGEVWGTMLWECYAALLREGRLDFGEAQARMRRYLVASLKLTPPDPTLLEARDALLAAAYASDRADFELFFKAFARRGAGAGARGPAKDSPTNGPVTESFHAGNELAIDGLELRDDTLSCDEDGLLDEGETGTLRVKVRNAGAGTLSETVLRVAAPGLELPGGVDVAVPELAPFAGIEIPIAVRLAAPRSTTAVNVEVTAADPSFDPARTPSAKLTVPARSDEIADASRVDRVDTSKTSWTASGDDDYGGTRPWARVERGDERYWNVPNALERSDHFLTSPTFVVEGASFELAFRHRHSFRFSSRRATDLDGGVVEIRLDGGGGDWEDISRYADVDYNSVIAGGRGDNALLGRRAYGNVSEGYPDTWHTSTIRASLPGDGATVQLRFRVSTGTGFRAADGWDIDDITLTGTSAPFFAYVPHQDRCMEDGPSAFAGAAKTVRPSSRVTLAGEGNSKRGASLAFAWTQVEGPAVALEDETTPTPTFEAPAAMGTRLAFELRVADGTLLSPASRVDVVVGFDGVATGSGCATAGAPATSASRGGLFASALAFALALARRRRRA